MKTNVLALIITLVVGIILTGALLGPIVDDYSDASKTIKNNGSYFTTSDDGEHTITIQHGEITYDGEPCVWPDLTLYGSVTLMGGSDWFLRVDQGTNPATDTLRYLLVGPPQQLDQLGTVDPTSDDVLTITISGDDITVTHGTITKTREGLRFTICNEGDYVLSHDPYLLADTPIYAAIRTLTTGTPQADIFQIIEGTVGDAGSITSELCRLKIINGDTIDVATSTFSVSTSEINGNLLKLDSINQTIDYDVYSTEITIDYVIVPESITYENGAYIGSGNAAILGAIPIMVIVAILMVAVGAIAYRRAD